MIEILFTWDRYKHWEKLAWFWEKIDKPFKLCRWAWCPKANCKKRRFLGENLTQTQHNYWDKKIDRTPAWFLRRKNNQNHPYHMNHAHMHVYGSRVPISSTLLRAVLYAAIVVCQGADPDITLLNCGWKGFVIEIALSHFIWGRNSIITQEVLC